jgi:hypothetical protein
MSAIITEFDVKRDPRKRFTIAEATFEHYHAQIFDDGHIELHPRILVDPTISLGTLERMDDVMEHFARGHVGPRLDAAAMAQLAQVDE